MKTATLRLLEGIFLLKAPGYGEDVIGGGTSACQRMFNSYPPHNRRKNTHTHIIHNKGLNMQKLYLPIHLLLAFQFLPTSTTFDTFNTPTATLLTWELVRGGMLRV
jgi:hypothetical protein